MIELHRSNSLTPLLDALASTIAAEPPAPLEPETIVVDSPLHARWLSERLALRFGVWANPSFPFLRAFLQQLTDEVVGPAPHDGYSLTELPWHLASELVDELDQPEGGDALFASVRSYLGEPRNDLRLIELCHQLAATFDRYFVYRPQWILAWQRGKQVDHWQARLGSRLCAKLGPHHLPARLTELVKQLDHRDRRALLPRRLHLFGITHLPPLLLSTLAALARHVEVHLYVVTPTTQFLGELDRRDRDAPPVLAASARRFSDMQQQLEGLGAYREAAHDLFVEPTHATLLGRLRSSLLTLQAPEPTPLAVRPDPSIELHACHSPLREVEVAVDRLLDAFADSSGALTVSDVAIVTPDLERYAPLCAAVLAEAGVPFRIAGHSAQPRSTTTSAFVQLLELHGARLSRDELLTLFDAEPVQRKLALEGRDRQRIERWLDETYVRWGIDVEHRQRHGSARGSEGTWRFGLARLLWGVVADQPLQAVAPLPLESVSIADGDLVGRVLDYLRRLFAFLEALMEERTASDWLQVLADGVRDLLADLPSEPTARFELEQALRQRAQQLAPIATRWRLPAAACQTLLVEILSQGGLGLPDSGALLVTDLQSFGALPRRIILGLGFGDVDFPRSEARAPFDRMAEQPLRGDPSRRNDDRARFVQLLLAAEQRLILTYVGFSQQDDAQLAPSIVLEELRESLARCTSDEVRASIEVAHPLQPFSPRNFAASHDPRRRSYHGAFAATAPQPANRAPFFAAPLDAPPRLELSTVELAEILDHPIAQLCRRRLGLNLRRIQGTSSEVSSLWLDNLDGYNLEDTLLELLLDGATPDEATERLHRSGLLAHDTLGESELGRRKPAVIALATELLEHRRRATARRHNVELGEGLPIQLVDQILTWDEPIGGERGTSVLRHRVGSVRGKDLLQLWIEHLCVLIDPERGRWPSHFVTSRQRVRLAPLSAEAAHRRLRDLLELAVLALRQPVRLLPSASLAYQEDARAGDRAAGYKSASTELDKRADAYRTLFFGEERRPWEPPPLVASLESEPTWEELAARLYEPILAARETP